MLNIFKSEVVDPVAKQVREAVVETVTRGEQVPLPTSHPARGPRITNEEMDEYIKVAEEVGVDSCTDLTSERLLRCLREENIHIFDTEAVYAYLDNKLGNDWEWRGLRTKDAQHLAGWHVKKSEKNREISFSREPYRGAVPLPVLLTVKKILQVLPEDVYFYVSAPKDNDGDPFLCVTSRWLGTYIIERWNEPNFRER